MELIKRSIHRDCLKCKASTQITLEDDINISDSRPDALKLLMDRGNVVIEEVKVTEDHVDVKGKLLVRILYLAEGDGTEIAAMEGSISFGEQIYAQGAASGDSFSVRGEIEDLTVGLINSRKFSVKSVLSLTAVCEEVTAEELAVELTGPEPVEFRKRRLPVAETVISRKDIFRIKQEVEIPGSFPNIFSMIWWEAVPGVVEFKVLEDKIAIQGDMKAFFLYRGEGEDEEICHYETTLPFSGSMECSGAAEGMIPEIRYQAEMGEIAVRPDFDGEERVITFELCLPLDMNIYEEEELYILSDVYGVEQEVTVTEREAEFRRLLARHTGKMKLSEHFEAEEGVHILKLLHILYEICPVSQVMTETGLLIGGQLRLQLLYETSAEKERYGVLRETLPFQYLLEMEGAGPQELCPLTVEMEQITASVIDGREVDVKCVLFFCANHYQVCREKIVEQIATAPLDSEKMASLPGIAIYVVREGDSLWDIGKRYYVPVSVIKQTNELTSDEVKCGDRILIVKGAIESQS